jgi:hypothetical protein
VLRAHLAALVGVGAREDRPLAAEDLVAQAVALVSGIQVVAVAERDGGGADELGLVGDHRAGGVAEHAVDAHAEVPELFELLGRLAVRALLDGPLLGGQDPGLHALELVHEALEIDDEIANDGEVREGRHLDAIAVVGQRILAGEARGAVHHHAAAPTHGHAARPAVRERAVDLVLDVVEGVQHLPVRLDRNFVGVLPRRVVLVGIEARDDESLLLIAHFSTCAPRAPRCRA